MGKMQQRLVVPALVCFALLTPGTASAGIHFSIGFGTFFGHHHLFHGWHGGWVVWPHYYWYDPWIYDGWPVVAERHVVIDAPAPERPTDHRPANPDATRELSQEQQQHRSELLKRLRIGDAGNRLEAVHGLGPFAGDDKVRTALERALLSDREVQVRKATAELFGRLRNTRTLPALKQAYRQDPSREVSQAAYKAIIMTGGYDAL